MPTQPVRRALVSVFNKDGLVELGAALSENNVEIVSTGSTAQTLRDAGYEVTDVSAITDFPEMLDGRVKTLHPKIHGGILANRSLESHVSQLAEHDIQPFDLVVVNLYPFEETVASGAGKADIIEKIDIGGPSMVRGAAKNFQHVAVIVRPEDYFFAAEAVRRGGFTLEERERLAATAFTQTAAYDTAISTWMTQQLSASADQPAAAEAGAVAEETIRRTLRYGENPHQSAQIAFQNGGPGFAAVQQHGGKAMSYNNYVDADAAVRAVLDHAQPCVAVVKHNNPCGIAICAETDNIALAHARAHATDPVSAYGGVIAVNRPVTVELAQQVKPIFTEVILAPAYDEAALELLQTKKNLRILEVPLTDVPVEENREIWGATLTQQRDLVNATGDDAANWKQVAGPEVDEATLADLVFAWRSVRAAKSNAILLAKDGAAVGVGMGQVNRLDSCRLAVSRANTLGEADDAGNVPERARGSVAASDAFFPFADGAQILIDAGVKAIVQPGGSIRDEEVIAAAEASGVPMFFTDTRHFAH